MGKGSVFNSFANDVLPFISPAYQVGNMIEGGKQAERRANQAINGQRQAAANMLQDQKNQKARDEATMLAVEQRKRQRMLANQSQGRQGTILTQGSSPLSTEAASGVSNAAPLVSTGKTLLGT